MAQDVSSSSDTLDVRDIIERFEEMEAEREALADAVKEAVEYLSEPKEDEAATDTNSTAEMGASDLEPRPLVAAPHPLAGEEIRRGDMVVLIDGRVRLHDRGEAVKRLLKEFALWSGGFEPEESSYEEREMFLCGRSLDHFLSVAMWPDRPDLHVEEGQ